MEKKCNCFQKFFAFNEEETDENNVSISDSVIKDDTIEEKEYKLHRVILLRSWLLHFIGNIHDYFMTRVLQSTQIGRDRYFLLP